MREFLRFVLALPRFLVKILLDVYDRAARWSSRLFDGLFGRLGGVVDSMDRADTSFNRIARVIFWPFKIAISLIGGALTWVFDNPLFRGLGKYTRWIWQPFVALAAFGGGYLKSRRRGLLIWGGYIVLLLLTTLFVGYQLQVIRSQRIPVYLEGYEAAKAAGGEQTELASLYLRKLQQLGVKTDQIELTEIEELATSGRLAEAIAQAEKIAPPDRPGFAAAHYWLANQYLHQPLEISPEDGLKMAEQHLVQLKIALVNMIGTAESTPVEIVFLESTIRLRQGRLEDAIQGMQSIADQFWPATAVLMEIHLKLNQSAKALGDARRLVRLAKRDDQILTQVNETLFPIWFTAISQDRSGDEFSSFVNWWYQRSPGNPFVENQWLLLQIRQIDLLASRGTELDIRSATDILLAATANLQIENRDWLLNWLQENIASGDSRNLRSQNLTQVIRTAAADNQAAAILLEVAGTDAAIRNEHQTAVDLLARATEKDPQNAIAWNNLAFVIHQNFPEKKEQALQAANKAYQLDPNNVDILETRGMILFSIKSWELALNDLQKVINNRPADRSVHFALSEIYQALNRPELAKIHRENAN